MSDEPRDPFEPTADSAFAQYSALVDEGHRFLEALREASRRGTVLAALTALDADNLRAALFALLESERLRDSLWGREEGE